MTFRILNISMIHSIVTKWWNGERKKKKKKITDWWYKRLYIFRYKLRVFSFSNYKICTCFLTSNVSWLTLDLSCSSWAERLPTSWVSSSRTFVILSSSTTSSALAFISAEQITCWINTYIFFCFVSTLHTEHSNNMQP